LSSTDWTTVPHRAVTQSFAVDVLEAKDLFTDLRCRAAETEQASELSVDLMPHPMRAADHNVMVQ
jgi:hypothetical protein